MRAEGATLIVDGPAGREEYRFAGAAEAAARAAFVAEALTWIGTPFRDCADVKGPGGAVDCAMMLARCAIDTGLIAPFDPRPYPPRWHLHRREEKFVDWITHRLGAAEVAAPQVGDVIVWQFGRTYSHGAVLINSVEVCHAYYAAGMVLVSRRDEPLLARVAAGRMSAPRPARYFDLWSCRTGDERR